MDLHYGAHAQPVQLMACSPLLKLCPAAGVFRLRHGSVARVTPSHENYQTVSCAGALKTKLQLDRGVTGQEAVKRNFSAEPHAAFVRELQRRIAAAQVRQLLRKMFCCAHPSAECCGVAEPF